MHTFRAVAPDNPKKWMVIHFDKLTTRYEYRPVYGVPGMPRTELLFFGTKDAFCQKNGIDDVAWCWTSGYRAVTQVQGMVGRVIDAINFIHREACPAMKPDFWQGGGAR